jgi:hypothetical protein
VVHQSRKIIETIAHNMINIRDKLLAKEKESDARKKASGTCRGTKIRCSHAKDVAQR